MPTCRHPLALGRQYSLGSNRQHQHVYRRGKSHPGRHLVLIYLKGRELKIGVSASAKVGNAVTRNRLRRYMREDFRQMKNQLKSGRYILIARTSAAAAGHEALHRDLRAIVERANLLRAQ